MKDNDMVALLLFNPEVTMLDMGASGINSQNTGIKQENDYLSIPEVLDNPKFKGSDGQFDQNKFHDFYINALRNYNVLAQGGWQPTYDENNIFAPAAQKNYGPKLKEVNIANPFRQTSSMVTLGELGPRTKSIQEIAQSQQVYNTETKEWMGTPEDSFFGTIGMGPLALAQWDFDADEKGNPTKDESKIKYHKGDLKLNDNGTFYYETLNGRSSYGKQLLHYSDIITKEDNPLNKVDFLDSDDIEKTAMGTLAKNVALVGAMFLPYVGPYVTAATLLQQSLKLGSTLGKMFLGSENTTMNSLQSLMKTTDLHESVSEHSKEQMWTWENLINTAGDAIGQLRQQRVLFEAVPWALGKGKFGKNNLFSTEGQEALQKDLIKKYGAEKLNLEDATSLDKAIRANYERILNTRMSAAIKANNLTKDLTKLSGAVSKAYMTGITVQDMFDEAVNAGMDSNAAAALTLGYAAAEYALLSTGLGELVLPELRAQRQMHKTVLGRMADETIQALNKGAKNATTPTERKNFFKKAFETGKKLYQDNRNGLGTALTNATVTGLGEGVEEVSEEALADAIKGIADLAKWTNGSLLNTDDWFDRYAMNFIGGVIGGGVNGITLDFSTIAKTAKLTPQEATRQVIHMINNGETEELFKAIDKNTWASKNLSATNFVRDEKSGQLLYAEGTEQDNQDQAVKTLLKNQLNLLIDVLEANGARVSDERIFNANTLKETRFRALADTSTAARYSEIYAQKIAQIAELAYQEQQLINDVPDAKENSDKADTTKQQLAAITKKKKDLIKELEDMQEGKDAAEFIGAALLEMHPAIAQAFYSGPTLDLFVQRNDPSHRTYEQLTEAEKAEFEERYENYKKTDKKDEALQAYATWKQLMEVSKSTFAPRIAEYAQKTKDFSDVLNTLYSQINDLTHNKNLFLTLGQTVTIGFDPSSERFASVLAKFNSDPFFNSYVTDLRNNTQQQIQSVDEDPTLTEEEKASQKEKITKDFELKVFGNQLEYLINNYGTLVDSIIQTGYLNPVVKQALLNARNEIANIQRALVVYAHEGIGDIIMGQDESTQIEQIANIGLNIGDAADWADSLTGGDVDVQDAFKSVESTKDVELSAPIPDLLKKIDKALAIDNSSPILNLLDAFALDVTGEKTNFSGTFANVNALMDLARGDKGINLSSVELDDVIPQIDEALKLVELVHSLMLGARSDTGGLVVNENFETNQSIPDLNFGINAIINEIKQKTGDSDMLYTVDGQTADNIMDDLHLLARNLHFWKNLYAINSGQKLSKQPRINLNQIQLIHKALQKLYDVAPEDIDKSMLSRFFEDSNPLMQHRNDKVVDDATLESLEKERIALEDALYEFGQVNTGKNFLNIGQLTSIFQDKGLILNESTEEMDQNTLTWYVASRMALKSSEFHNAFKQIINDEIAPLSIQELGVYLHTANVLNGDKLTELAKQVRQAELEYIQSLSQEERFNLIKQAFPYYDEGTAKVLSLDEMLPYLQNVGLIPTYDNITFLEGIAGSGKTRAVMKMTAEVLNLIKPELLDNAFVVDTSEKNAHNLAGDKGLQLKKYKAFDKESLLSYISDWTKPAEQNGIFQYIEGKDYTVTADSKIQSAYKLKSGTEVPKVIIIDEVGRYTDLELQTVDNYAKANGISVLTFGDLDQTRAKGKFTLTIPGLKDAATKAGAALASDSVVFDTSITRNSFIHGPKLGVSMRTRNAQQDKNQALMQAKLIDPQGDILFSYFEGKDKDGKYVLNGARVFEYGGTDDTAAINQVVELVSKLAPTLEKEEKIGVISPTADRNLWSTLKSKFGDIFEFYEGNSAQGREARYFIMDMDINAPDTRTLMEELNTGITRAQDGIIILTTQGVSDSVYHNNTISRIGNLPMNSVQRKVELSKPDIIEFARKRKGMYNRILKDSNTLPEYQERKTGTIEPEDTTPKFVVVSTNFDTDTNTFTVEVEPYDLSSSNWMRGSRTSDTLVQIKSNQDGTNVRLVFEGSDEEVTYPGLLSELVDVLPPEPAIFNPIEAGTQEVVEKEVAVNLTPPITPTITAPITAKSSETSTDPNKAHTERVKNDPMPILFYTNASLETGGWVKGPDGQAVPIGELDPIRIDSMNGLFNVLGLEHNYKQALKHLTVLHKILIESSDRIALDAAIQAYFKNTLNIDGDVEIQFGIWSSSRTNSSLKNKDGFGIYERNPEEWALFNDIDEDSNINNQNLAAVISVNGKNSLMLPIAYLSSPFTIGITMNGSDAVYPEVKSIIDAEGATNDAVIKILESAVIKNKYPALWDLFKLFHFTHNGFFPIEDPNFNPNSSLNNYGIQIDKNKGSKQINGNYQLHTKLRQEFTPMSEYKQDERLFTSKEAYMFSTKQITTPRGTTQDVLPGRPFVLVSTRRFMNDEAMLLAALDPTDTNTRLVYLLPPIMSFAEFADGLMAFDQGSGKFVGNDSTPFHILNAILNTDEDFLKNTLTHAGGLLNASEFTEFKTVLNELNDLFKNQKYGQFITKLKSDHNGFLTAQGNIEQKLAKIIRAITYPKAFNISTGKLIDNRSESNIDKISQILENGKFLLFDTVKYNNEATPIKGIAIPIKHDERYPFKVNGRDLLMDARVTTPTFGTKDNSFNLFIDQVVNKWIWTTGSRTNTNTGNNAVSGALHRAFIGEKPKVYEPTKEFNALKEFAEKLSSEGNLIAYQDPTDRTTDKDMRLRIIDQINTNPEIPYIVLRINNKPRLINYSAKPELIGTGVKNVSYAINSDTIITINGKNFSVERSGTKLILSEVQDNSIPTIDYNAIIDINTAFNKNAVLVMSKLPGFQNISTLLSSGRTDITLQELKDAATLDGKLEKLDRYIIDDNIKQAIKQDKPNCNSITLDI